MKRISRCINCDFGEREWIILKLHSILINFFAFECQIIVILCFTNLWFDSPIFCVPCVVLVLVWLEHLIFCILSQHSVFVWRHVISESNKLDWLRVVNSMFLYSHPFKLSAFFFHFSCVLLCLGRINILSLFIDKPGTWSSEPRGSSSWVRAIESTKLCRPSWPWATKCWMKPCPCPPGRASARVWASANSSPSMIWALLVPMGRHPLRSMWASSIWNIHRSEAPEWNTNFVQFTMLKRTMMTTKMTIYLLRMQWSMESIERWFCDIIPVRNWISITLV